jgi:hypothetical protein
VATAAKTTGLGLDLSLISSVPWEKLLGVKDVPQGRKRGRDRGSAENTCPLSKHIDDSSWK